MQPIPRSLIAQAREQHGLLTLADLAGAGFSERQRRRYVADGQLTKIHRGVFRVASHSDSFEQRCLAACLAAPDGALSGPTAGRLYGLRKCNGNDIHFISRHKLELVGVVAHRTNLLVDGDIQQRGALRLLRPARLACDLARFLDDDDLESVIEQMLDRKLIRLATVRDLARDFIRSGRDGAARLARVLDARPGWRRPVDSDLELLLLRSLHAAGLDLIPQFPVLLDEGRRVYLDLADPTLRFGVEVDHVTWHGGRLDAQRDKARDRSLMRLGWITPRVTDDDIRLRLAATTDQLVAIARGRQRQRPPAA